MPKIKRALISVYDKTGIVDFARTLGEYGVEIISTGGTAKHLNEHGIETRAVSDVTEFPEILAGRVKTLHPRIFGGLLSLRDNPSQMREIQEHDIDLIDLVVINLYPFEETIARDNVPIDEALENIDIGGPSMIRAAAKNFLDVTVVTSPSQYDRVVEILKTGGCETSLELRKSLAAEAFALTARYDAVIENYLAEHEDSPGGLPEQINMRLEKVQDLRYGENPHQRAGLFKKSGEISTGVLNTRQLQGKELSFNNLLDLHAAFSITTEFSQPCVAVIKHTNPCGIAVSEDLCTAYLNAKATDPVSAFGGIVGLNRPVDGKTAKAIADVFTEAIIAPGYEPDALESLCAKKNLRLMETNEMGRVAQGDFDVKSIRGGFLLQDQDFFYINDIKFEVVSKRAPTDDEWAALKFAWPVCKWVKSNAIVYATKERTIGIGAGQMSRVDSSKIAVDKARRMGLELAGTVVASDAFFPFRDGVDEAAKAGATAVVQPGGSIRDEEVIAAADEHGLAMVFTRVRHFRH